MCKQSSRTNCKHFRLDRGHQPLRYRATISVNIVGTDVSAVRCPQGKYIYSGLTASGTGNPSPTEEYRLCRFFRIFMQHRCCGHCWSINLFCNKHCHTVFCRYTFWYHLVLYFPIFIHFIYPQFCPHSIHTHVDNCKLIHRVDFLQAAYF